KQTHETENYYADERDKNRAKTFKAIEDEMALRRAQGEDSKKLDKEEYERKKESVQAEIDLHNYLSKSELERTKIAVENAQKRVDAVKREMADQANTDRYNKRLAKMLASDQLLLNEAVSYHNEVININEKEGSRLLNILSELNTRQQIQQTEAQRELTEKEKRERERQRKEYLQSLKKLADDEFALNQFRLKNSMDLNQ